MFFEILISIILGIISGIFTGLIPGVHINLVSIILLSISPKLLKYTGPLPLCSFIIAMATTHTFLDTIPSIFLGAPDADTALSVLPGHKLLLEGKGYEAVKLTIIGSLLCLIISIALMPLIIPIIKPIYTIISKVMGYLILLAATFMIMKESGIKKKALALSLFLISGSLGIVAMNWHSLSQPLFPLLSGLFGISTLFLSLKDSTVVPPQERSKERIKLKKIDKVKAITGATISGMMTGMLPGLGASSAALICQQFMKDLEEKAFLMLIGGISTVNFIFSIATLYTIEKARNGAIATVSQLIETLGSSELLIFISAALTAGGIATMLGMFISKKVSNIIGKIPYKKLILSIISLVTILVLIISGLNGLFVLIISSSIGIIAPLTGVKRSNAMGCIMLPVMLFFLL